METTATTNIQAFRSHLDPDGRLSIFCPVCHSNGIPKSEVFRYFNDLLIGSSKTGDLNMGNNENQNREVVNRIRYEVRDRNGNLVAIHERLEYADGDKDFVWLKPDGSIGLGNLKVENLPLYNIHKLQLNSDVVIVEGEKACEALWSIGVQSVSTYTAHVTPSEERLKELIKIVGSGRIYLWADNDEIGEKHMLKVADILTQVATLNEGIESPPRVVSIPTPKGVKNVKTTNNDDKQGSRPRRSSLRLLHH